jgi:predicted TIM-barrel fold metal-dependent hydrolase
VFLEAGCQWVPFIIERMHHRYKNQGSTLRTFLPQTAPVQKLPVMDYIKRGTIYFSTEVEDEILPDVLHLVGEGQVIFGSDMPHGDRERCAARMLQERSDVSESAKASILEKNPARLYGLP